MDMYRLLFSTRNINLNRDLFNNLSETYLLCSTSTHADDLLNHIQLVNPDILLLDLDEDNTIKYSNFGKVKEQILARNMIVAIMGDFEALDEFQQETEDLAELIIQKPTNGFLIYSEIDKFMNTKDRSKQPAPALMPAKAAAAKSDTAESANESDPNKRKHILIVDDDPVMLKLIREQIHDTYDTGAAINGSVALKFLESKTTDLILLDYEMPVMSGPEVLEKLRSNPETEHLPVVFLTGVTDKEKINQVLSYKPQGYLLKPIEKTRLINTIKEVIG